MANGEWQMTNGRVPNYLVTQGTGGAYSKASAFVCTARESDPCGIRHVPCAMCHVPFVICHSSFVICHSSFAIRGYSYTLLYTTQELIPPNPNALLRTHS